MKSRTLLLLIAPACFGLLAFALYLQFYHDMQPCPRCILQRYAFWGVALFSLIGAATNAVRPAAGLALIAALSGAYAAGQHLWVRAHPDAGCGIDPLETSLNTFLTARLWPSMFQADGMCTADYPPILGLHTPQWSLLWFLFFTVTLTWILLRRR